MLLFERVIPTLLQNQGVVVEFNNTTHHLGRGSAFMGTIAVETVICVVPRENPVCPVSDPAAAIGMLNEMLNGLFARTLLAQQATDWTIETAPFWMCSKGGVNSEDGVMFGHVEFTKPMGKVERFMRFDLTVPYDPPGLKRPYNFADEQPLVEVVRVCLFPTKAVMDYVKDVYGGLAAAVRVDMCQLLNLLTASTPSRHADLPPIPPPR